MATLVQRTDSHVYYNATGACGFCIMEFLKRECPRGQKIMTLPPPWKEPDSCVPCGVDVFRVPSRMSKQRLVSLKEEAREDLFVAWLDDLPDHCTCE